VQLTGAVLAGHTRRVVTVVFSDIEGSTVLGERLDPESVRQMMARYFDAMQHVLTRHGGTVEKFIGDAVVAVFGVPTAHEDDALRAVRAASEMRQALVLLNADFERSWGVTLRVRMGVNTGEVIAGDPSLGQTFVAGDAVNTAARLEQAAEPGEILVGEATYRLIRADVVGEPIEPLVVKGKHVPVAAVRLIAIDNDMPGRTRRLDSPLVGRQAEFDMLREIFDAAVAEGSPRIVTVVGTAGVGKSRLSVEFVSRLDVPATVISGRCLPYGDGITFWPVVEAVRAAADISELDSAEVADRKISALLPDESDAPLIRERLAPLLGLAASGPAIQETFWAVRKLFQRMAQSRPLIVVFDEIQWGEPTFLDLLEYVADWLRDVPVVLLSLARPELLETRPGWMAGRPHANLIKLRPLTPSETDGLILNLVGKHERMSDARTRIAQVAEGNPLFVGEVLRMLVDDGLLRRAAEGWEVVGDIDAIAIPPTIQALLAARLDLLPPAERAVIQAASVVGRAFWWQEVLELSPPELRESLTQHLQSLTRRELIEPAHSQAVEEDVFRFTHILIRDAAYQGIPKGERARLHERFGDWMEQLSRQHVGEYEEIRGYHFEQARHALLSLGPPNEHTETLGRKASATLAAAGQRAFARGDMPAAVSLLSRAAALVELGSQLRAELSLHLAFALLETGAFARLDDILAETSGVAEATGDTALRTHVAILRLWERLSTAPEGWAKEAQVEAEAAITEFDAVGDERGLARGWSLLGLVNNMNGHFGPAELAWTNAATHARRAGDRREELECLSWVPLMVLAGPTHIEQGLPRCLAVLEPAQGDKKAMASVFIAQAVFVAGVGRIEHARELITSARDLLREMGLTVWLAGPHAQFAGWIELLAGEAGAAEAGLRRAYQELERIGEVGWLSTVAGLLAEAVYAQERYDEAAELARISADAAGTDDVYSQVLWRSVRAKVLAHRGEHTVALPLAEEAVTLASTTDFLQLRWQALMSRADVRHTLDDASGSRADLVEAIDLARRKGNVVAEARAADALAEQSSEVR
jgi:class 3 adenylate cyclase/tetratricopeptide (TPR) repeat protein